MWQRALQRLVLASPLILTACPLTDDYYLNAAAGSGGSEGLQNNAEGGLATGGISEVAGLTSGGNGVGGTGASATGGANGTGGSAPGGASGTGGSATGGGTGGGASAGSSSCVFGPFGAPEQITGLGVVGDYFGPSLSADGLTLYLAVTPTGGSEHIYRATRTGRVAQFSAATAVASVNSATTEGNPYLSYDGLTLYFCSTRLGGLGGRDLWYATRPNTASDFANPTLLAGVNSTANDQLPWVSRDELTLLFVSNRNGLSDVWIATRTSKNLGFSGPQQLSGTDLNSSEGRAVESNDGLTVFFSSDRLGTLGFYDLWYATRPSTQAQFSNATNLTQLNGTSFDFDHALSSDETELLFSSARGGPNQLWRSVRACL